MKQQRLVICSEKTVAPLHHWGQASETRETGDTEEGRRTQEERGLVWLSACSSHSVEEWYTFPSPPLASVCELHRLREISSSGSLSPKRCSPDRWRWWRTHRRRPALRSVPRGSCGCCGRFWWPAAAWRLRRSRATGWTATACTRPTLIWQRARRSLLQRPAERTTPAGACTTCTASWLEARCQETRVTPSRWARKVSPAVLRSLWWPPHLTPFKFPQTPPPWLPAHLLPTTLSYYLYISALLQQKLPCGVYRRVYGGSCLPSNLSISIYFLLCRDISVFLNRRVNVKLFPTFSRIVTVTLSSSFRNLFWAQCAHVLLLLLYYVKNISVAVYLYLIIAFKFGECSYILSFTFNV